MWEPFTPTHTYLLIGAFFCLGNYSTFPGTCIHPLFVHAKPIRFLWCVKDSKCNLIPLSGKIYIVNVYKYFNHRYFRSIFYGFIKIDFITTFERSKKELLKSIYFCASVISRKLKHMAIHQTEQRSCHFEKEKKARLRNVFYQKQMFKNTPFEWNDAGWVMLSERVRSAQVPKRYNSSFLKMC